MMILNISFHSSVPPPPPLPPFPFFSFFKFSQWGNYNVGSNHCSAIQQLKKLYQPSSKWLSCKRHLLYAVLKAQWASSLKCIYCKHSSKNIFSSSNFIVVIRVSLLAPLSSKNYMQLMTILYYYFVPQFPNGTILCLYQILLRNIRVIKKYRQCLNSFPKSLVLSREMKSGRLGKSWVQRASMFYPNSCYNEQFYIKVQVHFNWLNNYMCIVKQMVCFTPVLYTEKVYIQVTPLIIEIFRCL